MIMAPFSHSQATAVSILHGNCSNATLSYAIAG